MGSRDGARTVEDYMYRWVTANLSELSRVQQVKEGGDAQQ